MYQLSQVNKEAIQQMSLNDYPLIGSPAEKALEDKLQSSLSRIPGVEPTMEKDERIAAMGRCIESERREFVAMHGDEFACELLSRRLINVVDLVQKKSETAIVVSDVSFVRQVA
jgi:hypothetical protein